MERSRSYSGNVPSNGSVKISGLWKRSQCLSRFTRPNYRHRVFILTEQALSYYSGTVDVSARTQLQRHCHVHEPFYSCRIFICVPIVRTCKPMQLALAAHLQCRCRCCSERGRGAFTVFVSVSCVRTACGSAEGTSGSGLCYCCGVCGGVCLQPTPHLPGQPAHGCQCMVWYIVCTVHE